MFSARNIHFAILGLILGASSGYMFAFYEAGKSLPPTPSASRPEGLPANHPDVNSDQMLALLKKAVEENPNQPEMVARYANVLFNAGRIDEALKWYGKVLELQPNNIDVRSLRGAVYWRIGRIDDATADLQLALKQDPKHIPTLYGMFLVSLYKHEVAKAEEFLRKVESIDPGYEGLPDLRKRLEDERRKGSK